MVFSSPVFVFVFLTAVYILYRLMPSLKAKNILLLIFSILFYSYGEPRAVILMLFSIVMNYDFGLCMKKTNRNRKTVLIISIVTNLAILGIFKYAGFGAELINALPFVNVPVPNIMLPIGISFYTFQAMSYVIDSYRNPVYIQKSLYKLALYITFFPQLIAGPIVKYYDFDYYIENRNCTPEKTAQGIRRFITGLAKKLLIANTMAVTVDYVYSLSSDRLSVPLAWLGAVSYMLQIYFDFSGYSDMAIGLGSMFGFSFKENFNYPYIAQSMQDFWRRWHISVSTWFKEYLYIPLGGNRKGKFRTALNKVIVFFCTGLWHGAGLNFIVWGLFNGLFVMLESYGIINPKKMPSAVKHLYTLFVTLTAFVFFRADSLKDAVLRISRMFYSPVKTGADDILFNLQLTPMFCIMLVCGVIFSMPVFSIIEDSLKSQKAKSAMEGFSYVLSIVLFFVCMATLSSASYNPFIYFRF